MPTTVLSRQRSWIAIFAALAMIASLLAIATPVQAAPIDTSSTCPSTTPSAGFTDIGGLPAANQLAIDCVAMYGITQGTSATTYTPLGIVSRWQMALFLTRQLEVHNVTLPDGSDQGFTDIGGLNAETQKAINQIAQLDITKGTTATTFSPTANVTREQMALFISRKLVVAGVSLADPPTDAGFTDISGLSAESQKAINQLENAHVVQGIGGTLYAPAASIIRAHMALFETRALATDGILPPGASLTSGPELIQVLRTDSDADDSEVTFLFSEDVTASSITPGDFALVDFAGNLVGNTGGLAKSGSVDNAVGGIWDTDIFDNAVAGTVATDGVEDLSGNMNPVKSRNLNSVTVNRADYEPTLASDLPELLSIGNFDPDTDEVDFVFDQDISDVGSTDDFFLILDDGTVEQATAAPLDADVSGDTATVTFNGLSQSEFNDVVRAFVDAGAVTDEDNAVEPNPPMAIDVSGGGNVTLGMGPNIESVDLSGLGADGEVVFTFDRNVADGGAGLFCITHFDGGVWGTDCDNPSGADFDGDEVTANFFAFDGDIVIYATVMEGAVDDDLTGDPNAPDTEWITHSFAAGETAGPDLVSIDVSGNLAGSKITVTLTFDQDVETGFAPFGIVAFDDDGDVLDIDGFTLGDDDGDAVITLVYVPGDDGFLDLDDADAVVIGYDGAPTGESGYDGAPNSAAPNYS